MQNQRKIIPLSFELVIIHQLFFWEHYRDGRVMGKMVFDGTNRKFDKEIQLSFGCDEKFGNKFEDLSLRNFQKTSEKLKKM